MPPLPCVDSVGPTSLFGACVFAGPLVRVSLAGGGVCVQSGRRLFAAGADTTVQLWDLSTNSKTVVAQASAPRLCGVCQSSVHATAHVAVPGTGNSISPVSIVVTSTPLPSPFTSPCSTKLLSSAATGSQTSGTSSQAAGITRCGAGISERRPTPSRPSTSASACTRWTAGSRSWCAAWRRRSPPPRASSKRRLQCSI